MIANTKIREKEMGNTVMRASSSHGRRHSASAAVCLLFLPLLIVATPLVNHPALAGEKTSPSNTPASQSKDYLIGPGDVLEIMVWKEPDLSRTVRVRMDGKISLPLADDVQAADSTLLQVKERITEALRGYLDAPAVYVMLEENRSKKIYIHGKVNAPGQYVLEKQMTLLQAIAMAGGFAEWADKGDIVVMRQGPKGQFLMKVNYQRAVSGKDIEQNILLHPDDVIIIP